MIVGILSDTHGRADTAAIAVRVLLEQGAEYLVHCGDIGDELVLDTLAGHQAMFVFGNNDYDRAGLARYAADLGIACGQTMGTMSFSSPPTGDKPSTVSHAIVTHGDDERIVNRVLAQQEVDYLFVGHTHQKADHRQGRVRVINPGALYRAARKTVAVLNTATDELRFLVIA